MSLSPKNSHLLEIVATCTFSIAFDYYKKLGMEKSENKKFPYKPARFVNGKKPYIELHTWDNEKKKLVRKRTYKNASEELAKQINIDLEKGNYHVPSNLELLIAEKEAKKQNETAIKAFQFAFENAKTRLRPRSVSSYRSHINSFCQFIKENYDALTIRTLQQSHVIEFLNVIQQTKKVSNKTRNAYGATIRLMLSDLKELDYVDTNVMQGFKNLKESKSTAHKFYTTEQRKKIKEVISIENPNLWLVCQIIFYTYVRPKEIRFLKIGYIEVDTNQLYIPAEISKNGKSERVVIASQLMDALIKSGFLSYHSDYYLFGKNGVPSDKPTKESQFTKEYHTIVRDRLKLSKEYTLYSWKHSGVVTSYINGTGVITISRQCRHHSLDQTQTYLRGMGVLLNKEIINNSPDI